MVTNLRTYDAVAVTILCVTCCMSAHTQDNCTKVRGHMGSFKQEQCPYRVLLVFGRIITRKVGLQCSDTQPVSLFCISEAVPLYKLRYATGIFSYN